MQCLAQDVQAHRDGDQRVEPQPVGERHRGQSEHDPDRGPYVGHQMACIRLQGDRSMPYRGSPQVCATPKLIIVDTREKASPISSASSGCGLSSRSTAVKMIATAAPRISSPRSRKRNIRPCRGRRVLVVGGRACHRDHPQRETCARQVDEGLHRIGEQADRSGQPPGEHLERNGSDRRGDRELHESGRAGHVRSWIRVGVGTITESQVKPNKRRLTLHRGESVRAPSARVERGQPKVRARSV